MNYFSTTFVVCQNWFPDLLVCPLKGPLVSENHKFDSIFWFYVHFAILNTIWHMFNHIDACREKINCSPPLWRILTIFTQNCNSQYKKFKIENGSHIYDIVVVCCLLNTKIQKNCKVSSSFYWNTVFFGYRGLIPNSDPHFRNCHIMSNNKIHTSFLI